MATRCCCPPDICDGKCCARSARPTIANASAARFRRSVFIDLRVQRGQFRVFKRCGPGQQIEALKNKSNLLIANQRQGLLIVLGNINPFK